MYGRRKPVPGRKSLKLGNYLTGIVPAVPPGEDYLAALNGGWQMLGNDTYGDCVAVTWANVRRLVTSTLTATPHYPSMDDVIKVYKTQNPGFPSDDNGMDIQTLLQYLVTTGGPDGVKACGFASVDHTNAAEVKAAIALFGYVWTGIDVLQVNQQEFSNEQPWDYSPTSPLDGGHSVITGGYGAPGNGPLGGDERFITWAAETSFTDRFWSNCVEEAWVVVWPEHLGSQEFLAGVDLQQLAADYQEITGHAFPASVTPPKPAPPKPAPPAPNVIEEIVVKLEEFLAWLKRLV
jgi:hypothetical protein